MKDSWRRINELEPRHVFSFPFSFARQFFFFRFFWIAFNNNFSVIDFSWGEREMLKLMHWRNTLISRSTRTFFRRSGRDSLELGGESNSLEQWAGNDFWVTARRRRGSAFCYSNKHSIISFRIRSQMNLRLGRRAHVLTPHASPHSKSLCGSAAIMFLCYNLNNLPSSIPNDEEAPRRSCDSDILFWYFVVSMEPRRIVR